jgi:hypothetical protein
MQQPKNKDSGKKAPRQQKAVWKIQPHSALAPAENNLIKTKSKRKTIWLCP